MRTNVAALTVVVLLVCFGVAIPIHAQGKCSLQTFAGTYVTYEKGSSLTIDLNSQGVLTPAPGAPTNPVAWAAPGIVPFINVGEVTFTPDGIGDGYFWMWAGTVGAMPEPIPVHIEVTEINEDCTGKYKYQLANGAVITERIIIFDNSRQFRSVPISLGKPGIPTLAWIGTGQRISKGSEPVHSCGPQTAHGSYLVSCENILRSGPYPTKAVADTVLMLMDVSMEGDYTGMLYEKYGVASIDGVPIFGTVGVNPDCSFATTITIPDIGGELETRGIYFNEGKEYYGMAVGDPTVETGKQVIQYSFCQGTRIGQ